MHNYLIYLSMGLERELTVLSKELERELTVRPTWLEEEKDASIDHQTLSGGQYNQKKRGVSISISERAKPYHMTTSLTFPVFPRPPDFPDLPLLLGGHSGVPPDLPDLPLLSPDLPDLPEDHGNGHFPPFVLPFLPRFFFFFFIIFFLHFFMVGLWVTTGCGVGVLTGAFVGVGFL